MTRTSRIALAAGTAAAAALLLPSTGSAAFTAFQTPSRNIGCYAADGALRCDIGQKTAKFPFKRPAACDLEWGDSLQMTRRSRVSGVCHGDTALHAGRVVKYGGTWRAQGFTCRVSTAGVTCRSPAGHGWFLSRQRIRVF